MNLVQSGCLLDLHVFLIMFYLAKTMGVVVTLAVMSWVVDKLHDYSLHSHYPYEEVLATTQPFSLSSSQMLLGGAHAALLKSIVILL